MAARQQHSEAAAQDGSRVAAPNRLLGRLTGVQHGLEHIEEGQVPEMPRRAAGDEAAGVAFKRPCLPASGSLAMLLHARGRQSHMQEPCDCRA